MKLVVNQCYQILIGQKLIENAKVEKFKCDIFEDFQTLCLPNFCWRFRTTLFSTFRDLRAPHFGIFLQSDKGNAGRLLPGIFHLFVNLFSFFCYPETLFKAARILPFISCGHIFAFGCLCHFNTLQTLQEQSRDFLFVSSQGTIAISMIFLWQPFFYYP